ncbi:MAG: winged helix-turn-helix domain-containing protein [Limibaculum sp.]
MGAAIGLREDFGSGQLRALARTVKDAGQARRLLALAVIYDGGRRTEAAKIGSVGLQIIRDWVLRFNARGPDGLIDGKAPGNPSKLNDDQRQALAGIVERGPILAIHGVVRWRLIDLMQWVWEEFGISLSEPTMSREMKALGYRKITARPRHYGQNEFAIEDFKKTSPPSWRRSGRASRPGPR